MKIQVKVNVPVDNALSFYDCVEGIIKELNTLRRYAVNGELEGVTGIRRTVFTTDDVEQTEVVGYVTVSR